MTKKAYTFDALCNLQRTNRAHLESPEGHLTLDRRSKWIPCDEIIVGGNLTIKNWRTGCLPPKVVVGGDLRIENCWFVEFPAFIEVKGDVTIVCSHFVSIHEGCHFHRSVSFFSSWIQDLPDHFHVAGDFRLTKSRISVLPKGLVVDGSLEISETRIKEIPEDCRCKSLEAAYTYLEKLPDNRRYEDLILHHSDLRELPKGLVVDGVLDISFTYIRVIPSDCRCKSLDATYSLVVKLPEIWSVEKLNLAYCPISEFPKGVRVTELLNISGTYIREIHELQPKIMLYASNSQLAKLPDHSRFSHLDLDGCPIAELPIDLKVQGEMKMKRTNIRIMPDDFELTGSLDASESALLYLTDHLVLSSLDVRGTRVQCIPAGIVSYGIYCDPGVHVDAYRFDDNKEFDFHPNGKFVLAVSLLFEIKSRDGNVLYCEEIEGWGNIVFVSDGNGLFAYGATITYAQAELEYRRMNWGLTDPRDFTVDDTVSFSQALALYRYYTQEDTINILDYLGCLPEIKDTYTIREWINVMKDLDSSRKFRSHFTVS